MRKQCGRKYTGISLTLHIVPWQANDFEKP